MSELNIYPVWSENAKNAENTTYIRKNVKKS